MSNKDWTDKLPDLLEDFTEAEPEGLWDAVQAGIAPKKRHVLVAWWYAGGALLAAAAVSAVFFLWPSKPELPSVAPVAKSTPAPELTVVPGDAIVADVPAPSFSGLSRESLEGPAPVAESAQNAPAEEPMEPLEAQNPLETLPEEVPVIPEAIPEEAPVSPEPVQPESPSVKTPEITDESTETDSPSVKTPDFTDEPAQTDKPARRRERFQPSLKVQMGLSATNYFDRMAMNTTTGIGMPANPGIRPNALPATKATSDNSGSTSAIPKMLSRNKASTTDATHAQSARLALGVTVGITEHWGVETGIVSSMLNSHYATEAGGGKEIVNRDMRYIGIPLYVRYNALQWKRLSLYLNAGPMYEYATKTMTEKSTLMGTTSTGHNIDNTLINDAKWSLNAGGGLQLRVLEHGALYVLPGVSYHFAGNSTLENFYTEHPFSASVTFGYNFLF